MAARTRDLPDALVERLTRLVPGARGRALLASFARARPTTLRANTLRTTPRALRETLAEQGLAVAPVAWLPEAFELRRGRERDMRRSQPYLSGELYMQGLSSMLAPLALDPRPGERVLDLAAAPGGKTTHMAARMRDRGSILACDSGPVRFEKLRALVELQGATCVELRRGRGERVAAAMAGTFDRVLLDAPCSSEARIRLAEPATWRGWSLAGVDKQVRVQRRLMRAALRALVPGGVLVYATCTFAPEENEGVVQWALEQADGDVALEPLALPVANAEPGRVEWNGQRFDDTLRRTARILPTPSMEGFFLARLRRRAS